MIRRQSLECERLYHGMVFYSATKSPNAPPMVQMRGMYGKIFEPWLKDCDVWAWTDLDVIFGDLKGWMQGNPLVYENDIVTFSGMDWYKLYTRGQFTAHVQMRGSYVNEIWRHCDILSSLESITDLFYDRKNCLDEVSF
jgi:hypothetical protein